MSKNDKKQTSNIEIVAIDSVLKATVQIPKMEFECFGEQLSLMIFDAEDIASTPDAQTALKKCIESVERNLAKLKTEL